LSAARDSPPKSSSSELFMTSFVKDPENAANPGAPVALARPQPVALEVPVTVNGARAVDGSAKREPFSEHSQTVLVFGHGAVIRVSAALAPGQLIFLTNEKTKKEVVCQVVKSKSDGSSVGYVELRFTEPSPGFWGMRFPLDTVLPQAATRPAGPSVAPVTPKVASPVQPAPPVATAPPVAPRAPKTVAPAAPVAVKPVVPTVPAPAALSEEPLLSLLNSGSSFEAKSYPLPQQEDELSSPVTLPVVDAKPVLSSVPVSSSNSTTEELKQQAARLQEQLSSLLFTESKPASADSLSSSASQSSVNLSEVTKQLFETAATGRESAPAANAPRSTASQAKSGPASSPEEELQIPAWLAPLARETDASLSKASPMITASSLPVLPEAPAEVAAEPILPESPEPEVLAQPVERLHRPETAVFGGQLLGEASSASEIGASKSRTGLSIGIAAGLLVIAGGFWYSQQPGNAISGSLGGSRSGATTSEAPGAAAAPASRPDVSSASPAPAPVNSAAVSSETAAPEGGASAPTFSHNSNFTSTPVMHPTPVAPNSRAGDSGLVQPETSAPAISRNSNFTATPMLPPSRTANPESIPAANNLAPAVEQPKKPSLGQVRLAAPKVNGRKAASTPSDSEPSIDVSPAGNFAAPVSALSTSRRAEPTAPAPIGGDVKPARLIKSVPPIYPDMARTQHLSGNVQIDASIAADGNVGAMKVLSGPTLLHQAALNAVKQWKFQPAELDGKPTAMHLTVTVQFRAQ